MLYEIFHWGLAGIAAGAMNALVGHFLDRSSQAASDRWDALGKALKFHARSTAAPKEVIATAKIFGAYLGGSGPEGSPLAT